MSTTSDGVQPGEIFPSRVTNWAATGLVCCLGLFPSFLKLGPPFCRLMKLGPALWGD